MKVFNLAEELEKERKKNKELEERRKKDNYFITGLSRENKEQQDIIIKLLERINKVIEDLEKTKELNDKHILARDNIIIYLDIDHIEYLLDILKGEEDENI